MKTTFSYLLIILSTILFLFLPRVAFDVQKTTQTFIFSFIPSLLPCLLLINFIVDTDAFLVFEKFFKSNTSKVFYYRMIAIILTIVIGIPGVIPVLEDLKKKNKVSNRDATAIVSCYGGASLSFHLGVIIPKIDHQLFRYYFLLYLLIASIIYALKNKGNCVIKEAHIENKLTLDNLIPDVFKKTAYTLISIFFVIVLCSIPQLLIVYLGNYQYFISALIDFSYGSFILSEAKQLVPLLQLVFVLSSTSLCQILQFKITSKTIKTSPYIINRLLIGMLTCLLLFILAF